MPTPPRWVWAALLDIFDALSHVPVLALPWLLLALPFLSLFVQQRWVIT